MLIEILLEAFQLIQGDVTDVLVLMDIISELSVLINLFKEHFEVLKHANLLADLRHGLSHLVHLMLTLLTVLVLFTFGFGGREIHKICLHGLVLLVINTEVVVERDVVGVCCLDERWKVLSEPTAAFAGHSCGCIRG